MAYFEGTAVASRRSILTCVFTVMALALGCRGDPTTVLTRLQDSRRVAAELRVRLSQAVDASNRAVMAKTDEASSAAARESEQATKAVQDGVATLEGLLRGLDSSSDLQLLSQFSAHFSEYEKLDRRILDLAVENTNHKAQALSFGVAGQAADDFCQSLESLASSFPASGRCRVDGLVAEAELSVRRVQVLHAPHIAEQDEVAMTRMEKEMRTLEDKARGALKSLAELAPPSAATALAANLAQLDRFKAISEQIVELSRRNTNVLSLDLSLRQKPGLVAACDGRLRALQEALANDGSKATR